MHAEARYYVYEWVRPDYREAYYVGKGSGKRAYNMVRGNSYTDAVTAKLIKNGMSPEVRIIARFANEDSAFEFEKERIAFLMPLGFLTNNHPGGKAPPSSLGKRRSKETKLKLSVAKIGDLNPMKRPEVAKKSKDSIVAYHQSDEGKEKAKVRGAKLIRLYETPQGKEILQRMGSKISEIQSSKGDAHHSKRPEVKEKIRASKVGGKNPSAKAVRELTTGLEFSSASDAARYFKIRARNVWASVKLGRFTKSGLKFQYIDKEPSNG